MGVRHVLPVLLLLLLLVEKSRCLSARSHPYLAYGRKLARHGTRSDEKDIGAMLEQLLATKVQTRKHVNSEVFGSYKLQQQQHFNAHPADKQGILMVAGGRDMFANAAITIMTLRRQIRSQLPVEIVHFGQSELPSQDLLSILQSLNATSIRVNSSTDAPGHIYITDALQSSVQSRVGAHHKQYSDWKGFPAKAFALAFATRFQQVMLLDADSMPLVDPSLLLEMPAFQRSGSLFWPDFWRDAWVNDTIYSLVGDMEHAPWHGKADFRLAESGQILFDRLKHADVLEYIWLLNSHNEWVYKHMHGDKDTYLLAFSMAGKLKQYKQVQTYTRDGMTDQLGHKHRYHHLGGTQSVPYKLFAASVAKALRGKSNSIAAQSAAHRLLHITRSAGSDRFAGADSPSAARQTPPASSKSVRLKRESRRHAGVPVVFHRTSFNSKFFPDCLDEFKIKSKYCEVQYLSVPLSHTQAAHSIKPNMYAFDENQVDTTFYEHQCTLITQDTISTSIGTGTRHFVQQWQHGTLLQHRRRSLLPDAEQIAPLSQKSVQQLMISAVGLPPEWACERLTVGDNEMPLGVMPVQVFSHILGPLQYSYEAFREVRERLKV